MPITIRSATGACASWCRRAGPGSSAPPSSLTSGLPDPIVLAAQQHAVQDLPDDALVFLLGSRYCETDRLSDMAWAMFGNGPTVRLLERLFLGSRLGHRGG